MASIRIVTGLHLRLTGFSENDNSINNIYEHI